MSRSDDAMTCPDARELFSAALDDALGADERERLDIHLAGCADCRRERERFERTVGLLRGAEPIRAPAGFVDRVLAAARPEPWWRRLARRLVTPWAVKLPLEAAAVALVAITAVYLYRDTPEPRQIVEPGTPAQESEGRMASAPPEPGTPPRAPESREAVRADRPKSRDPEPSSTATLQARSAPDAETPAPTTSMTTPRPPTPPDSPISSPVPTAPPRPEPPPDSPSSLDSSRRAYPLPRVPSAEAPRPRSETVPDMPRRPSEVEGLLSGIAPASGRVQVAELVTRLGGAVLAERREAESVVITIELPRARYGELARGLAQLGRWTATDLPETGDPVRIHVRLVA